MNDIERKKRKVRVSRSASKSKEMAKIVIGEDKLVAIAALAQVAGVFCHHHKVDPLEFGLMVGAVVDAIETP